MRWLTGIVVQLLGVACLFGEEIELNSLPVEKLRIMFLEETEKGNEKRVSEIRKEFERREREEIEILHRLVQYWTDWEPPKPDNWAIGGWKFENKDNGYVFRADGIIEDGEGSRVGEWAGGDEEMAVVRFDMDHESPVGLISGDDPDKAILFSGDCSYEELERVKTASEE